MLRAFLASRIGGSKPQERGSGDDPGVLVELAEVRVFSLHSHLTELTYEMVSESQLPHKVVNLLFTFTDENNKFTVLWES